MAKVEKDPFRCSECGWSSQKWVGRCGECQAWGSVEELAAPKKLSLVPGNVTSKATPIGDVDLSAAHARPTGVSELDRVLGGGLVPGAAILLAGEPGVGKSTLLLSVAAQTASKGIPALYVSGEESASQVRLRAERIKAIDPQLFLASETDLGAVIAHIDAVKPQLLIIDSVQTIGSSTADGSPGGVTQVREVAGALIRICKDRDITLLLVGHVTKDGSIAGPRLLEHIVDVVLQFEGERHSRLRLIRAIKNRFGASDEVGCFDLSDSGIESVLDPTGLFTSRHAEPVPGTCVTVTLEGRRPLLAEIQALVSQGRENDFGNARRVVSGLDSARTSMTLAVLELRAGVRVGGRDVYAATVGGMKMSRLLEHIVDVVLQFEGERHSRLRLIRAIKNRFGASDEVGCFDLSDSGIESVLDPTGLFTSRHAEPVPGTCVTVTLEGRRPLLAEIQALVSQGRENDFGNARRVVSGLDSARTSMTLAVLELRAGVRVGGRDVYAATVGGMKMSEPAADLALALAVASAAKGLALPSDLVAIGEVGLAGEIRRVSGVDRRLQEAFRLGFKRALVPTGSETKIAGMEIFEVSRLDQALKRVKITGE